MMKIQQGDSRITTFLIDEVQDIIDGPGGSLTKFNKIMNKLWKANIPYRATLSIWDVLVHPENRSGLGLNPFDVHKTLAKVKEIGADKEAVHRACAFEMAPVGEEREAQIAFNQNLIERASGMLADLRGQERVCSVATSHFTAGCRAAVDSCETPEVTIKDKNGKLNFAQLVEHDTNFAELIQEGWQWTILPYIVQVAWPKLPDLIQDALNAEHATFSMASELQVMVSIANRALAAFNQGQVPDWAKIKNEIRASQPPCADYLETLCEFVRLYAGGNGAPIVRYLEGFGKEWGGGRKLGEAFLAAVVAMKFATESSKFPFVRSALLATNLISPKEKVVDGISKLVSKSDCSALSAKNKLTQATAAELLLSECWTELRSQCDQGNLSVGKCNGLFGKVSTRCIIFMLKKQKEGPDNAKYESFSQIKDKFEAEKQK